jgi:hypothetical protein
MNGIGRATDFFRWRQKENENRRLGGTCGQVVVVEFVGRRRALQAELVVGRSRSDMTMEVSQHAVWRRWTIGSSFSDGTSSYGFKAGLSPSESAAHQESWDLSRSGVVETK